MIAVLFSSSIFIFTFLPVVLFCYFVLFRKSRGLQNIFLLLASLFFYGWGEPKFVFVMIGSIIVNWLLALLVDKYREKKALTKALLSLAVIVNLSLLFVFKYLNFTVNNLNHFLSNDIQIKSIALPIGISFFTFQAMSYVIDVYRKNGEVQKNPMNVGLYIAFFPQLIAGPIVRYQTIADQIKNRKETLSDFSDGIVRFITGFCKKIILSDTFALIADAAFDNRETNSVSFAWIGAIAYTLQIYFDFGGYSDMGIGLGKMFGFHFLENFDYPYISTSVTEFWRRWHISLGSWFRDYVYFPLGGSRVEKKTRLVFNLFVVWFLTGVWHGANWTFILWGLMYFVLLVIEKLTDMPKSKKIKPLRYVYTMFFVVIGWVLFRSENVSAAFDYIGSMFGLAGNGFLSDETLLYGSNYYMTFVIGIFASLPIVPFLKKKISTLPARSVSVIEVVEIVILFVFFFIALSYMVKGTYSPFIYFNF